MLFFIFLIYIYICSLKSLTQELLIKTKLKGLNGLSTLAGLLHLRVKRGCPIALKALNSHNARDCLEGGKDLEQDVGN